MEELPPSPHDFFVAIETGNLPAMREWWRINVASGGAAYDVDCIRDPQSGASSLMCACVSNDIPAARFLVETCGANVHHRSLGELNAQTVLHVACGKGHLEMIRYLVEEAGADVAALNVFNETTMAMAFRDDVAAEHAQEILEYLWKADSSINLSVLDEMGFNTLHSACLRDRVGAVRFLVEQCHADLNTEAVDGRTALLIACAKGNFLVAKYILSFASRESTKFDIDRCFADGETLLHAACEGGNLMLVQLLVETYDAKSTVVDENGVTALHIAAQQGNVPIVEYLVSKCCSDVLARTKKGAIPLHFACGAGRMAAAMYLLASDDNGAGASLYATDNDGWSVIHYSAKSGDDAIVGYFASTTNVNATTGINESPLLVATSNGHFHIGNYLVDTWHVDVNAVDNSGWSALHHACQKLGNLKAVKSLIQRGCKFITKPINSGIFTPIHLACEHGHLETVKYLIEQCNVNVSLRDCDDETPLHTACSHGRLQIVKYLVEDCGASLTDVDRRGYTPWHFSFDGSVEVVEYLLNTCQVDTTVKTKRGSHAVFHAVGKLDCLQFLLENCPTADVNRPNNENKLPLHYACMEVEEHSLDVVKYLVEECKVDVAAMDDTGSLPLHYACQNDGKWGLELVKYLIEECQCGNQAAVHNKKGLTAMHTGFLHGNLDLIHFLIRFDGGTSLLAMVPESTSSA